MWGKYLIWKLPIVSMHALTKGQNKQTREQSPEFGNTLNVNRFATKGTANLYWICVYSRVVS